MTLIESAIDVFQRATELNLEDPVREGSLLCFPDYGQVVMTGDLHGHRRNFEKLVKYCLDHEVRMGFDSCSAPKFEKAIASSDLPEKTKKQMIMMSESCESSLFSSYISVEGAYWNCSFCEGADRIEPVDVLAAKDFVKDVWYSPQVMAFREKLLATAVNGCRTCPVYDLGDHG